MNSVAIVSSQEVNINSSIINNCALSWRTPYFVEGGFIYMPSQIVNRNNLKIIIPYVPSYICIYIIFFFLEANSLIFFYRWQRCQIFEVEDLPGVIYKNWGFLDMEKKRKSCCLTGRCSEGEKLYVMVPSRRI